MTTLGILPKLLTDAGTMNVIDGAHLSIVIEDVAVRRKKSALSEPNHLDWLFAVAPSEMFQFINQVAMNRFQGMRLDQAPPNQIPPPENMMAISARKT